MLIFFGNAQLTLIILYDSQEAHKLLQPVDNTLKTMALEFAEYQA